MVNAFDLVRGLVEGLNITDSEAARSGLIARNFAHDGVFSSSLLPQPIIGCQALLQTLQSARWQEHGTAIRLEGKFNTTANDFKIDCKLVDANGETLFVGSLSGQTTKSNNPFRIQEISLILEPNGTNTALKIN